MAVLQEIAQIVFNRINPNPDDESAVKLGEVIASARHFYATTMWTRAMQEKQTEQFYEVPSHLITEVEKDVIDNTIDISDLPILKALPNDSWLLNVGGLVCGCEYIRTTVNRNKLLCDDVALEAFRTCLVIGNIIRLPKGAHKSKLPVMFANDGSSITDPLIYIDDSVAGILMDKLQDAYNLPRIGKEDETNDSNSTT